MILSVLTSTEVFFSVGFFASYLQGRISLPDNAASVSMQSFCKAQPSDIMMRLAALCSGRQGVCCHCRGDRLQEKILS
jgi:hypothetical protein